MENVVYSFARHCLRDSEFNAGGIPTKEAYYLKKLGWTIDSPELEHFYDAIITIYRLNQMDNDRKRGMLI